MDLAFDDLDPEASDSPTVLSQKQGVTLRSIVAAAEAYVAGPEEPALPEGAEWDVDSGAPVVDVDSGGIVVNV